MKISRTAYVARTAHDQTHGNKLVLPEYGVIEIRLKKGAAESKSYLPASSSPRRKPKTTGEDKFCFAPGTQWTESTWTEDAAKNDAVKVCYHLYNPFSIVTEAKLELFRRFDKTALWERKLEKEELLDGEHELEFDPKGDGNKVKEWDGALGKESTDFPDGFVTAEHSPYKLRLTLKGDGLSRSPVAWTHFHILIEKLELEWGVEEALANDAVKRKPFMTAKTDYADPKAGALAKIYLESNIYKTSSAEMFDNTLFTEYETLWGQGAELPVFAKIWVRDAGGNPVLAPKALGGTKFLWDWESKAPAASNAFAAEAQDYDKDATKPKGLNCHLDRGGKRGDDTNKVFADQAGYDAADALTDGTFPFKVVGVDRNRKWAAYSTAWRKGKLAAKTGVLFQPARTAGDRYQLTLYAAHEVTDATRELRIDVDKDPPIPIDDKLKTQSREFEIWRRAHLIRYVKKSAGVTNLVFGTVTAFFRDAFLELKDDSGGIQTYPAGEWNTNVTAAVGGWATNLKHIVDAAVNQHASGANGLQIRTRRDFRTALRAAAGLSLTQANTWMTNNGVSTDVDYANKAQDLGIEVLLSVFNAKMRTDIEGTNIFQVRYTHNLMPSAFAAGSNLTDGMAADFAAGDRNHCGFLSLMDPTASVALGFTAGDPDLTAAHEFGHHFFLPHPAPVNGESGYSAHDTAVTNCVMSYVDGTRAFCGLCMLRLRGWDKSALSTTSASNKKP